MAQCLKVKEVPSVSEVNTMPHSFSALWSRGGLLLFVVETIPIFRLGLATWREPNGEYQCQCFVIITGNNRRIQGFSGSWRSSVS